MVSVIDLFLFQEYGPLRIMQNIIFTKSLLKNQRIQVNKENINIMNGIDMAFTIYTIMFFEFIKQKQWSQL